jgi:hypothetical protein
VLRWVLGLFGPPKPPTLEEERFPSDRNGRPDLSRFTKPLSHYIAYLDAYHASLRGDLTPEQSSFAWQTHAYRKGVLGQWGIIARGPAEALAYVLDLLSHPLAEGRQAGAGVLDAWADTTSSALAVHALAAAEREAAMPSPDGETLSTLLNLLGRLGARDALPLIARVLRAPGSRSGDVDYAAAETIALFAGDAFDQSVDSRQAAERWLREQGL